MNEDSTPPGAKYDSYAHKRPIDGSANFFLNQHIVSDQVDREGLRIVCESLTRVITAGISGDVVEFGCYIGTTSLYLRRLLDALDQAGTRELHVYDSFAGLPPKANQDSSPAGTNFQAGALAVHKKDFIEQFRKANLRLPRIHKAWFSDLDETDVSDTIAFGFLDGDFYASIMDSLRLTWPRLSPGGTLIIDDYGQEALPGVERAVHDFFKLKPARLRKEHNMAILSK